MTAITKDRPLVDGENEYITLTVIKPVMAKRNHLHPDWWQAEGLLDGKLMRLTILREDRALLLAAGYVPDSILKNIQTAVSINILTRRDDANRWRIAEVVSRDEDAPVHTEAERIAAWKADIVEFGRYTKVGESEAMFSTSAKWVSWSLDSQGRYVRQTATDRTLYAAKAVQS